jgi:glycerate kinase
VTPPSHSGPLPALVAPDSFKGTFSAREVAAAIAGGLRAAGREARELPVADGGEGTMEVLVDALGGDVRTATVSDPLGRPVEASFALLPDGSGVVEMAQASGLSLVDESERDAWAASTRGTGELIAAAADAGASPIIVTVGGSATTDGGAGALEALKAAGMSDAPLEMHVVCDVRVPFEDAPRVFGPQKGADPAMVKRLERRLDELAETLPRDPRGVPMTGCAGGLSGGLWAALGAELVPGAPYVLDTIGFDALMRGSAFLVTGEGSLDEQTLQGKIVGEVATRCRQAGLTCHAIVGRNRLEPFEERIIDLASVTSRSSRPPRAASCSGGVRDRRGAGDGGRHLAPGRRRACGTDSGADGRRIRAAGGAQNDRPRRPRRGWCRPANGFAERGARYGGPRPVRSVTGVAATRAGRFLRRRSGGAGGTP